jgi:hypothetical protein
MIQELSTPENQDVPFQVQYIINSMMDKKERTHIRDNYRMRLLSIRDKIDDALRSYDSETMREGNFLLRQNSARKKTSRR